MYIIQAHPVFDCLVFFKNNLLIDFKFQQKLSAQTQHSTVRKNAELNPGE